MYGEFFAHLFLIVKSQRSLDENAIDRNGSSYVFYGAGAGL
jgi:hypothetical protein